MSYYDKFRIRPRQTPAEGRKIRSDAMDAEMEAKGYEKVKVGRYVGYRLK